jgi:hypothetical protein
MTRMATDRNSGSDVNDKKALPCVLFAKQNTCVTAFDSDADLMFMVCVRFTTLWYV